MEAEFSDMMRGLGLSESEWENGVAVGVSGGADSTCLALLAHSWCEERGLPFLAIACDHGLRPESRHEAALVAQRLEERGIECRVLSLRVQPGTAIQERARNARYKAMASVLRREGIGILAVGHHAMDQAETVAHRIASGNATPLGLAGMLPVRVMEDALLVRPLLSCGRGTLRDYLRERGMPWTEDPSNGDRKYARVRIRMELASNPGEVDRLLSIASESLDTLVEVHQERDAILSKAVVHETPWGASLVDPSYLGENMASAEAVRELIRRASGGIAELEHRRMLAFAGRPSTLGGAESMEAKGGLTWFCREASQYQHPVHARAFSSWDGRIRLAGEDVEGCHITHLGMDSTTDLRRKRMVPPSIPHKVLSTAPCIRDAQGRGVSVPQMGIGMEVALGVAVRRMPQVVRLIPENTVDKQPAMT